MEKLLRILFVISVIAFVTTATACADDNKTAKTGGDAKTTKTGGNDKTAKTGGDDKPANAGGDANTAKTAKTGGNDKTAKTGGDAKPAINPDFFKFTAEAKGVTIDTTKDVYKITINPSLLTYVVPSGTAPVEAFAPAPIFTVTFTDDKQGFIIPTTVDKAEALTTTHVADLPAAITADIAAGFADAEGLDPGADNNVTHSFLADDIPGFGATELNADWSTLAPRRTVAIRNAVAPVNGVGGGLEVTKNVDEYPGVKNILTDTKVRVSCVTTMTGINKDSFLAEDPDAANDLAIAKGTETVCSFSLVGEGTDDEKTAAYKKWAEAAVELAKDDATKNIQKMGFVGIVTGDDTASDITKAAGSLLNADITAATSAKLVKAYTTSLQKVEIVIAAAK